MSTRSPPQRRRRHRGRSRSRKHFDKSLLVREGTDHGARFRQLETIKAYAESRLDDGGETNEVRTRLLAHFHRLATERGRALCASIDVGAALHRDRSNVTAAFEWAAERGQWTVAGELLLGALGAYESYGHASEARSLYRQAKLALAHVDPNLHDQLSAAMLSPLLWLDDWQSVLDIARGLRNSSDADCRAVGWAWAAFMLCFGSPDVGARYLANAERHLAPVTGSQDPNTTLAESIVVEVRGVQAALAGDYTTALHDLKRAFALVVGVDRLSGVSTTFVPLIASLHLLLGAPDDALKAIELLDGLPHPYGNGSDVVALAHLALGDINRARTIIRSHAQLAATGRRPRECNDSLVLLAFLAHAERDDEVARRLILAAGLARQTGMVLLASDLAHRLGVGQEHALAVAQALSTDAQRTSLDEARGTDAVMAKLQGELHRRQWSSDQEPPTAR